MNDFQVKLDQKENSWFFIRIDRFLIAKGVGWVPSWLQTNHLTLMTLLWSVLAIASGYLSSENNFWLWGFSLSVILQYITDMLDGAVGRQRKTGLITWGYYMDHFLDYVFMCAVFWGYSFMVQGIYKIWLVGFWALLSGFMIHTFLDFSVTRVLKISYCRFGTTELRYLSVMLNSLAFFLGVSFFHSVLPFLTCVAGILLVFTVYKTNNKFYEFDIKNKSD